MLLLTDLYLFCLPSKQEHVVLMHSMSMKFALFENPGKLYTEPKIQQLLTALEMTSEICNPLCDVVQRKTVFSATNNDSTVTVCILYWGIECTHWHIVNINSIAFAYPTRYQDFNRCTILTSIDSPESYYLDAGALEVPCAGSNGDKSSYILCYLNQADYTNLPMNRGFTSIVCNNVQGWYGPVLVFATDPLNNIRSIWEDDGSIATYTLSWYVFTLHKSTILDYQPQLCTKSSLPFQNCVQTTDNIERKRDRNHHLNGDCQHHLRNPTTVDSNDTCRLEQISAKSSQQQVASSSGQNCLHLPRQQGRRIH